MIQKLKLYLPQFNLLTLMLIGFLIPIYIKVVPLLIVLFFCFNLIDGIINNTFVLKDKRIFITAILFFLAHLISTIYSKNQNSAWFDIEIKLSLFVFPVIFLFKNNLLIKKKKNVLFSFVFGSIISSFIMLYGAFVNFNEFGFKAFEYSKLSEIISFHPSYISMYLIFSIFIIIKYLILKKLNLKQKILPLLSIIFLVIIIFLLQSKAGLLAIIFISFYLLIVSLIKLRSLILKLSVTIIVMLLTLIFVQKSSRLEAMYDSVKDISSNNEDVTSTGIRYEIWKLTIAKIKENPILGVGAGDIKEELFKEYKKKNFTSALDKNLNVHNQFLETFLGQGIIGFSLLLALFYFGFREAHRRRNWLLTVFLMLTFLSFGPESMLNTQSGVIFFAFFYFFLFQFTSEEDIVVS